MLVNLFLKPINLLVHCWGGYTANGSIGLAISTRFQDGMHKTYTWYLQQLDLSPTESFLRC